MDIYLTIVKILSEQLGVTPDKVTMNSSFKDDLGADSLDMAEMMMIIRDVFEYELTDEEVLGSKQVKDIAGILQGKSSTNAK